jgi:hypothetical protein
MSTSLKHPGQCSPCLSNRPTTPPPSTWKVNNSRSAYLGQAKDSVLQGPFFAPDFYEFRWETR